MSICARRPDIRLIAITLPNEKTTECHLQKLDDSGINGAGTKVQLVNIGEVGLQDRAAPLACQQRQGLGPRREI